MSSISKSPDRYTFQRDNYLKDCKKDGIEPNQDLLAMYDKWKTDAEEKWEKPETKVNNLEYDLLTTDWILEKVRDSESYSQNLYAAMCNNDFVKNDVWPILADERWSCTWRSAGGIIADMRQEGDYIDWYCSGIGFFDKSGETESNYVPEGMITDEIRSDLLKLGWIVYTDKK